MKDFWEDIQYFTIKDFTCPCCGKVKYNEQFVKALDMARHDAGIPFVVNSGYRCEKHNKKVGGSETSSHMKGFAVDIKCNNSTDRRKIILPLSRYFTRIGIAKTFIHVDIDFNKAQNVFWVY